MGDHETSPFQPNGRTLQPAARHLHLPHVNSVPQMMGLTYIVWKVDGPTWHNSQKWWLKVKGHFCKPDFTNLWVSLKEPGDISLATISYLLGCKNSCEVAIIWPEWCVELGLNYPKPLEVQYPSLGESSGRTVNESADGVTSDWHAPTQHACYEFETPQKMVQKSPWMKLMMFWSDTCFTSLGPNHDPKFHQAIIGERLGFQWPPGSLHFLVRGSQAKPLNLPFAASKVGLTLKLHYTKGTEELSLHWFAEPRNGKIIHQPRKIKE